MTPYYSENGLTIYHADCREVLPYLPKCDLLLTDPPYKQSKSGGGLIAKRETYAAIRPLSDFDPEWLLSMLSTVGKYAHGYIFCSKDLLAAYTAFLGQSGWGWDMLAYTKANPLPTKNNKYLSDIEYLLFYREAGKCYFNNDAPFQFYSKVKRTICSPSEFGHPTEKDVDIIGQLIQISTREGELILDPFVGSGTTLVAAKSAGRKAIGVEIEEKYCEIAAQRLERESRQQTMDFKATQESMVFG